jgi:hypothetical protein
MKLISKSNDYIKTMDAWDIGLLKTCMLSFGVILGTTMRKENKKKVIASAGLVYAASSIAVIVPYLKFLLDEDQSQ